MAELLQEFAPTDDDALAWKVASTVGGGLIVTLGTIFSGGTATIPIVIAMGSVGAGIGYGFGANTTEQADKVMNLLSDDDFKNGGKIPFMNKRYYQSMVFYLRDYSTGAIDDPKLILANNLVNSAKGYLNDEYLGFLPTDPNVDFDDKIIGILDKFADESSYIVQAALETIRGKGVIFGGPEFPVGGIESPNAKIEWVHKKSIVNYSKSEKKAIFDAAIKKIENGDWRKESENKLVATIIQNGFTYSEFNAQLATLLEKKVQNLDKINFRLDGNIFLMPTVEQIYGDSRVFIDNKGANRGKNIYKKEEQKGVLQSLAGVVNDEASNLGRVFKSGVTWPDDAYHNADEEDVKQVLRNFTGFEGNLIPSYQFAYNYGAGSWSRFLTELLVEWNDGVVEGLAGEAGYGKIPERSGEVLDFIVKEGYYNFLDRILIDLEDDSNLSMTIGQQFTASFTNNFLNAIYKVILADKEIVRRVQLFKQYEELTEDGDLTAEEKKTAAAEALKAWKAGEFEDKVESKLSEEDLANRQKFFKQCALMINLPTLRLLYEKRIQQTYAPSQGKVKPPYDGRFFSAHCGQGSEETADSQETLISKLISSEAEQKFFELKGREVSTLVPKIKLFRVDEDPKGGAKEVEFQFDPNYNADRQEVVGPDYKSPATTFLTERFDKGTGCGLKEFSWEFNGTNPAEARNDIKATLKLFFQSFDDLIRYRKSASGDVYRFVDLIIQPTPNEGTNSIFGVEIQHNRQSHPLFYRIRAEVGYNIPPNASEELSNAIEMSNKSFFLCMVDHDLSFNVDGTVQVSISYRAYLETLMKHPKLDALASPELIAKREENAKLLANQIAARQCTKEELRELQISLQSQEEVLVKKSLTSIMDRLISRGVIYSVLIDDEHRKQFLNDGYFKKCSLTTGTSETTQGTTDVEIAMTTELPENSDDFNFIDSENRAVQFFFFGDLLYTILDCVFRENSIPRYGLNNNKIILGSFEFDSFTNEKIGDNVYGIAQIPISVDFFSRWFVDNITSQKSTRRTFPVLNFIRTLSNSLIKPSLLENCINRKIENKLRFQTGQVTAFDTGGDPLLPLAIAAMGKGTSSLNVTNLRKQKKLPLAGGGQNNNKTSVNDYYNYIVLCALGSSLTFTGTGDYEKDIEDGRFHVHIGAQRGIVKSISLSKVDQQYIREARFFQDGIDGLLQLAAVYSAKIEMFGNTIFLPGMEFFFNPYGLGGGTNFGRPQDAGSVSHKLGIGGYHTVTSVHSSITPGKFVTTVDGMQYYSGDGSGNSDLQRKSKTNYPDIETYDPTATTLDGAKCTATILSVQNYKFDNDVIEEVVGEEVPIDARPAQTMEGQAEGSQPVSTPTVTVEELRAKYLEGSTAYFKDETGFNNRGIVVYENGLPFIKYEEDVGESVGKDKVIRTQRLFK
jgi:hypothetical protein